MTPIVSSIDFSVCTIETHLINIKDFFNKLKKYKESDIVINFDVKIV